MKTLNRLFFIVVLCFAALGSVPAHAAGILGFTMEPSSETKWQSCSGYLTDRDDTKASYVGTGVCSAHIKQISLNGNKFLDVGGLDLYIGGKVDAGANQAGATGAFMFSFLHGAGINFDAGWNERGHKMVTFSFYSQSIIDALQGNKPSP